MKAKIIIGFIILWFVSSCKDDALQMLVLHTPQQVDNTIILNWEEANISEFQYYMVMCSSDKQRYDVINDIVTPTSDAFRKEITTFEDCSYPLGVDTLYYKIMAIGKETMSSQNLCYRIERPVMLLKGNNLELHYIKEANKLSVLFYNYPTSKLKTFDLATGQLSSNEANIDGLSLSSSWFFWGENTGKTEFYSYNGYNNELSVYNASTLQSLISVKTPYITYDPFTSNNKGMVYIYSYYYLYFLNRTTGTFNQYQPTSSVDADWLFHNSKDNKLYAIEYNGRRIQTFNLDDKGDVLGVETYTITNNEYPDLRYIENSSLFIITINSSDIKILDMNTKTLHNTDLTQMPNLASLHNNVICIADRYSPIIYQLSLGDFKKIKTTRVRVVPNKFFTDSEYLYFFGQYGYGEYLFDKIRI